VKKLTWSISPVFHWSLWICYQEYQTETMGNFFSHGILSCVQSIQFSLSKNHWCQQWEIKHIWSTKAIYIHEKWYLGRHEKNMHSSLNHLGTFCYPFYFLFFFKPEKWRFKNWKQNLPAMAKRLVAFLISHHSFTLVFVSYFIIAASNHQIRVWESIKLINTIICNRILKKKQTIIELKLKREIVRVIIIK